MISRLASARSVSLLAATLLLAACRAEFEPDITGPGMPPPPPPVVPNLPFRLGSFGPDFAVGVVTDALGRATVASYFQGAVDFDPSAGATVRTASGGADVAVARYDEDGALDWLVVLNGSGPDLAADIARSADGGTAVVGVLTPGAICSGRPVAAVRGGRDAFLMKVSAGGACEWVVAIGGEGALEEARDVMVDAGGDLIVTGSFTGTVDFDPGAGAALLTSRGGSDVFVVRFSATGTFKGVVQLGGAGDDAGAALTMTATGDVVVGGEFTGTATFGSGQSPITLVSAGESDFFLAQLAPSLGVQWAVRGGGSGADYLMRNSILIEPGGTLVVVGMFSGTADLDGGSGTALVTSQGGTDVFFARFAGAGQLVGTTRRFGGAGSDGAQMMVIDDQNNFYVAGWFSGSVDFDPGAGVTIRNALGSGGAGDAYILALTPGGELRWVNTIGGAVGGDGVLSIGSGLALTTDGALWAVGRFFGLADLDPGPGAISAQSLGDADQFVVRVEQASGLLRR